MKPYRWMMILIFCIVFAGVSPDAGQSAEPEDINRQALKELLTELERKIDDADKRMVAHPKFLEELRALVDKFRGRLREVFLKEDFSDGDYVNNPTWVVDSGRFRLTPSRRLWSRVYVERPVSTTPSREKSEPLGAFLQEIMRSAMEKEGKKQGGKEQVRGEKEASIHSLARIGPAFEVDLELVSESRWGSMEVVLLGGEPAVARYRVVYQASPSAERPIQIVRERGSRRYVIESATEYPALDDGTAHRVQWIRDYRGRMLVIVDGKEVLSTVELFYQTDFSGIALVNRGGTYEWGPIRVLGAARE